MEEYSESFVGLDTSKLKISVAIAASDRGGEVRFYGDIGSDPGSVASMGRKRESCESGPFTHLHHGTACSDR